MRAPRSPNTPPLHPNLVTEGQRLLCAVAGDHATVGYTIGVSAMTISRWRSGALRPSDVNREILEARYQILPFTWDITQAPPPEPPAPAPAPLKPELPPVDTAEELSAPETLSMADALALDLAAAEALAQRDQAAASVFLQTLLADYAECVGSEPYTHLQALAASAPAPTQAAPRPPAVPLPLPLHSFVIRKVQARAKPVGCEQATTELLERGMHAETIAVALAAPAPGPFAPR